MTTTTTTARRRRLDDEDGYHDERLRLDGNDDEADHYGDGDDCVEGVHDDNDGDKLQCASVYERNE